MTLLCPWYVLESSIVNIDGESSDFCSSLCIRATTWQNLSSGDSDQARHKPAWAATEASQSLEISAIESRDIILSKQRTTKALIRLSGCAGWSAPLLFAYDIRHIFSWPGSYIHVHMCCTHSWLSKILLGAISRPLHVIKALPGHFKFHLTGHFDS